MPSPELNTAHLPLSALLSQALVAFTIEFDNEFEHQMPHRTTRHSSSHGPWLVSLVMWSNCMRFVTGDGISVGELESLARTPTNWNGMERWGYIVVEPDPADSRPKPPRSAWVVRATTKGRQAREVWRPLFDAIEKRWQERFGRNETGRLRESLWALVSRMDVELPGCLPILGYGLFSRATPQKRNTAAARNDPGDALPALLSRALLAFAIEFERESALSLAISANLVRVLDGKGVPVRDLPLLSGVSKEAVSMALGVLGKARIAVVEPDETRARTKVARLAPKGQDAQDAYHRLTAAIEERWGARFGQDTVRTLRESLERLAGDGTAQQSPLFRGLEPYPDGWRASVRKPATLPHYPMVLHRGGFPDGS